MILSQNYKQHQVDVADVNISLTTWAAEYNIKFNSFDSAPLTTSLAAVASSKSNIAWVFRLEAIWKLC